MHHPTTVSAIQSAVEFYDRMLDEYTPRTAHGLAVVYLVRKTTHLPFSDAARALDGALAARARNQKEPYV